MAGWMIWVRLLRGELRSERREGTSSVKRPYEAAPTTSADLSRERLVCRGTVRRSPTHHLAGAGGAWGRVAKGVHARQPLSIPLESDLLSLLSESVLESSN